MDICVIGAGYVGLVTSACFAHLGNNVIAVDANPERLASLKRGEVPFYEPGLNEFIKEGISSGFLTFSDKIDGGREKVPSDFYCGRHASRADRRPRPLASDDRSQRNWQRSRFEQAPSDRQ